MRAINRAAWGTGLALAACVMSLPATTATFPVACTGSKSIHFKKNGIVFVPIARTASLKIAGSLSFKYIW